MEEEKWKDRKRYLTELGGKEEDREKIPYYRRLTPRSFPAVLVEWETIGANPVFFYGRPVSFPKPVASFGFGDIHDYCQRNPLNVNKLVHT